MKTSINKTKVMKRAWAIFRGNNPYSYSFSSSLRRAWFIEKESLRIEAEKAECEKRTIISNSNSINIGDAYHREAMEYYQNAPRGTYFGD